MHRVLESQRATRAVAKGPSLKHHLTASRITLGRRCLYWARPDVELPEQQESRPATQGSAFHAVAEAETDDLDLDLVDARFELLVAGGAEAAASIGLSDNEKRQLAALAAAWRAWMAEGLIADPEPEQVLVLSGYGAGSRLERTGARDYDQVDEYAIPGTADLTAIWAPNDGSKSHLFVGDYKTGFGPHYLEVHIDQLTHLGTALARAEGADTVRIGVLHVTPDGVELDDREIGSFEMALHVQEMAELLDALPTAEPRPGLHCDDLYCPARAVCPATRALLLDAKLELEPRRRLPIAGPIATDEQAVAVLVAESLIVTWLAERLEAVKAWADKNDGIRHDGRVYRGREVERETPRIDVAGAVEALREVLGADADKAIKTKTTATFSSIREALRGRQEEERRKGKKVPMKDLEEHAREALRQVGALKVSKFRQYEWKKES